MKTITLSVSALLALTTLSIADNNLATSLLNDVSFNGEIRTRYENAEQVGNATDTASAITNRFALGAKGNIGGIEGLSAFGQVMAVSNFGYDHYAPENTTYDTIADPSNARITQSYIDYTIGKTLLRAGNQMVNLDDERFIGAVGWRQMPQTFLGYTVVDNSVENLTLLGSYVTKRYGILDNLSGGTKTVLLNANYKATPELQLTGYGYLIGSSSDTYGAMASGKSGTVDYLVEVAQQKDASIEYKNLGKPTVDALYYRVNLGTTYNGMIAGITYESLGKADGKSKGFTTPLATLHKWQGFSDAFLGYTSSIPRANTYGLNDMYAQLGYTQAGFGKVLGIYHIFNAQESTAGTSKDAGSELDLLYAYPLASDLQILGKAAFFKGESNSVIGAAANDINKYWLQLDYTF
jgi:hypothetical protein